MAKKRAAKKTSAAEKVKTAAEVARETTFILQGTLKRVQLMYLRVGELLVEIRDKELWAALKYPDMESYAEARLGLGRTSLYNYLRIRDWVVRFHPEWLKPKAKGFIPDLTDVGDLMWIEDELTKKNLTADRRARLLELQQKGLAGKLRQNEVRKLRGDGRKPNSGLKNVISKLRQVRKAAAALVHMSPEAIAHLDAAIKIMVQDKAIEVARLDSWKSRNTARSRQNYLA